MKESDFKDKYPVDSRGRYHTCQLADFRANGAAVVKTVCQDVGNPMNGFMHFDHAGGALIVVAQTAIPDAQYEVLTRSLESEPSFSVGTFIFFALLVTLFCTFMQLGLFLAVIAHAYAAVSAKGDRKGANVADDFSRLPSSACASREKPRAQGNSLAVVPTTRENNPNELFQSQCECGAVCDQYCCICGTQKSTTKDGDVPVLREKENNCANVRKILNSYAFRIAMYLAVLLQASTLMIEGYAMKETRELVRAALGDLRTIYYVEIACNAFFALEVALLFSEGGFSMRQFAYRLSNVLWFTLFALSLVGFVLEHSAIVLPAVHVQPQAVAVGKVFHALQSVRMFRLMSISPALDRILDSTIRTLHAIFNITVFLLLCTFCTAVIGRYLLEDKLNGRSNFSNFYLSMLTSFQIFSLDSWSAVLYDAMASAETPVMSFVNAAFVILWLMFSNFVIGNLFISAIVSHIQLTETMKDISADGLGNELSQMVRRSYDSLKAWKKDKIRPEDDSSLHRMGTMIWSQMNVFGIGNNASDTKSEADHNLFSELQSIPLDQMTSRIKDCLSIIRGLLDEPGVKSPLTNPLDKAKTDKRQTHIEKSFHEPALCGFTEKSVLRRLCIAMDENLYFETFIVTAVISNCVVLILMPPYPDVPGVNPSLSYALGAILNMVFTFVFMLEFIVRSMARGLIFNRHSYFSSGWNSLDFAILVVSLVDLLFGHYLTSTKAIRAVRILSPLKVNCPITLLAY